MLCYNSTEAMRHRLRSLAGLVATALVILPVEAHAARLAVVAVASPHGEPPVQEADALTSYLIARKHRTITSADVAERLLSGNEGAGADWAARLVSEIRAGREALTRLDRHGADRTRREGRESIERAGGGAAGPLVLVEWALLEAALATAAGDARGASDWIERAAALGPSVVLDPLVHPEPERQAFQSAAERAHDRPRGEVTVASVPSAAELWTDGVRRCLTPCTVKLPPGKHFVRVASPAHVPAVRSLELDENQTVTLRFGLSSAYNGASLDSVRAMLDDPSRTSEAQSSLASIAGFLDVDHVIVVRRGPSGTYSLRVAPAATGNDAVRRGLPPASLASSATGMIRTKVRPAPQHDDGAWYESTALWVGVASVAAVAVGAGLLLSGGDESGAPSQGTLVIGGP